jgi:hypothetical protein
MEDEGHKKTRRKFRKSHISRVCILTLTAAPVRREADCLRDRDGGLGPVNV